MVALNCGKAEIEIESSWKLTLIAKAALEASSCGSVLKFLTDQLKLQERGSSQSVVEFPECIKRILKTADTKQTCTYLELLAACHRLKLLNDCHSICPLLKKVSFDNLQMMEASIELVETIGVTCVWNVLMSDSDYMLSNQFPLVCKSSSNGAEIDKMFMYCLGSTGLFLFPRPLRLLSLSDEIEWAMSDPKMKEWQVEMLQHRLKALNKPSDSERTKRIDDLFGNMLAGFITRVASRLRIAKRSSAVGLIPVFYEMFIKKVEKGIRIIDGGPTWKSLMAHMKDATMEALVSVINEMKLPIEMCEYLMTYLLNSGDAILLVILVEGLSKSRDGFLDQIKDRRLKNILVSINESVKRCEEHEKELEVNPKTPIDWKSAARELQVKLIYPHIMIEELHGKLDPAYLSGLKQLVDKMQQELSDDDLSHALEFLKLVRSTISKMKDNNLVRLSGLPNLEFFLMEIGSHLFQKGRDVRSAVFACMKNCADNTELNQLLEGRLNDKIKHQLFEGTSPSFSFMDATSSYQEEVPSSEEEEPSSAD